MSGELPISQDRVVPGSALHWEAVRSSGPGGQKVNKTASKVRLRFDPRSIPWLDRASLERLRTLAGTRSDGDGCIVLSSELTRDQRRNLEDARTRLGDLIRKALVRPKKRIATRPTKGSQRRRLDTKKRQGDKKKLRGKVDH